MNIRRFSLAMGIAAAVACLPLFGTTGAIVSPMAGTVAVNGQPVAAGSAIVAGDMVSTSAAGSARMVLPGGSLIAGANTNFRMENVKGVSQIRLNNGLVEVSGTLPVALATRTVVPASSATRFNVYDLSGKVYVETVAGTVAVNSAKGSVTVPAGKTASFNDSAAVPAGGLAGLSTGLEVGSAGLGVITTVLAVKNKNKLNTLQTQVNTLQGTVNNLPPASPSGL